MRILKITEYSIEFDNGKDIRFDHDQDCCEINYADFEQLDSLAREVDFSEFSDASKLRHSEIRFDDLLSRKKAHMLK